MKPLRKCKFEVPGKQNTTSCKEHVIGWFHKWSLLKTNKVYTHPVGICEDKETGKIYVIDAEQIIMFNEYKR